MLRGNLIIGPTSPARIVAILDWEMATIGDPLEQRSGRAMTDIRWYQTLALWKSAIFMEGNYRRAVTGSTDDPYLKGFGEGVAEIAEHALEIAHAA